MYQTIYQEKFGVNERKYKNNFSIVFNTMWRMNPLQSLEDQQKKQLVSNSRPRKIPYLGEKRGL
jgi:hypothetical protein